MEEGQVKGQDTLGRGPTGRRLQKGERAQGRGLTGWRLAATWSGDRCGVRCTGVI